MALRFLLVASLCVLCRAGEVEFVTTDLPWAAVGRGYAPAPFEIRVAGKCPLGGVGYSVVSGVLPEGILLSASGNFSGIPVRKTTSHFVVRASDGCSWTARLFSLVVEDPPTIAIAPGTVVLTWRTTDSAPPAGVIHVSSTWPGLRYRIRSTAEWLVTSPDHGFMFAGDSSVASDAITLLAKPAQRTPGRYQAAIEISAWQAEPVRAIVELNIE